MCLKLASLTVLLTQPALAEVKFAPVAIEAHSYTGGWEHFVGGGVASFDCNGDGLPELYAAGGEDPAQLFRNTSKHDISFSIDTPSPLALTSVTGAYPIDVDSDGVLDLAILRVGQDVLLRGSENCEFSPFATIDFDSEAHWTTAFSATWEADAILPTLAFGTYVDRKDPDGPFEACDATQLYRPSESTDMTYAAPEALEPGFCTLSILFSDWNRNGYADLRISNDRHYYVRGGSEQMWSLGAQLDAEPRLYGAEDGWQDFAIWGMGIASRDVTGDGRPEMYLTSMGDQKFQVFEGVQKNSEDAPTWRDATYDFGTTAHRPHTGSDGRPSTGWHAQFGDVNNDGLDDIFVTKGNVEQMPSAAMQDPNSLLLQNMDGRFEEASVAAGVASMSRGRGGAVVDLNGDGALDIVVVNRRAPMEVYQNTSTALGTWLAVEVQQDGPNSQAVGAFIEIRTGERIIVRETTIGGGHASGQAGPQHFGLGDADSVEVRVIWPDGFFGEWRSVQTNRTVTFKR